MKTFTLSIAVGLLAASAIAQGTVNFANIGVGLNAPVFDIDLTTKLSGNAFLAQLYVGTSASESSLIAVPGSTPFLTGGGAGYFSGGTKTLFFPSGSRPFFQVRVWEAAGGGTYEAALAAGKKAGKSSVFQIGVGLGGLGPPPTPSATLIGFTGIPEPARFSLTAWKVLQVEGSSFELGINWPAQYAPIVENWYKDGETLFPGPVAPEVLQFQNATRAQSGVYMAKGHRALMPGRFETESAKVVIIPRIVLAVSRRGEGNFAAELDSGSDALYALQYKPGLAGSAWTTVATVTGNGSRITLLHTNALSGQGFYRVEASLLEPQ